MTVPDLPSLDFNIDRSHWPSGPENLRCYIRETTLPWLLTSHLTPQIPQDHKSHCNTLAVRQEPYRILRYMHAFKDDIFEANVTAWMNSYIPEHSLHTDNKDPATGEALTVECPKWFNVPGVHNYLVPPQHIASLQMWINNLPLTTVQRVMHLSCPPTRDWRFDEDDDENDRDGRLFRHYLWTLPHDDATLSPEITRRSMVVAFQPPWILSPKDLDSFADCRVFPPFRHGFTLNSKERLWAKIWDLCVRKKTSWFILTSYHGWVFGAFSKGLTRAYVSSVYHFNCKSPTILQCVLFWLASAMCLPGGWQIPEVPEPVENMASEFSIPMRTSIIESHAPSESNQSDAGSSAGFEEPLSPRVSEYRLPSHALLAPLSNPIPHPYIQNIKDVQTWRQSAANACCPFPIPASPALSAQSFTSISTIRDLADQKGRQGTWLVGIPEGEEVS